MSVNNSYQQSKFDAIALLNLLFIRMEIWYFDEHFDVYLSKHIMVGPSGVVPVEMFDTRVIILCFSRQLLADDKPTLD